MSNYGIDLPERLPIPVASEWFARIPRSMGVAIFIAEFGGDEEAASQLATPLSTAAERLRTSLGKAAPRVLIRKRQC